MAAELQGTNATGTTCYFLLRTSTGTIWNGSAFETYTPANYATYAITGTEQGASGFFVGDMPAVVAGIYSAVMRQRLGGSPAESDPDRDTGNLPWDGTKVADYANVAEYASGQDPATYVLASPANKLATDGFGHTTVNLQAQDSWLMWTGTAQGATATTITLANNTTGQPVPAPALISIIKNTGYGQSRTVVSWNSATSVATVHRPWDTNPDNTSTYVVRFMPLAETDASGRVTTTYGIHKNTALNNFEFVMYDSTDHVTPKTGLTVSGQVSIDGAAFVALTNSPSEVSNGTYKINLAAADTNGTVVTLKFTATGADQTTVTLVTQS